mgnify:CR=1 FL=1|jgi:uncharacterized protein
MSRLDNIFHHVLPDSISKEDKPDNNTFPKIDKCVSGEYAKGLKNKVYISRTNYNVNELNIRNDINITNIHKIIETWAQISEYDLKSTLFLDTETTGLTGGAGTFAFMIGLGYYCEGTLVIEQYFLLDPIYESEMLTLLTEFCQPFTTVVTFNGKSYDMNLLKRRFIIQSIQSPFENVEQIDLLHLSRRMWKNILPDCSLQQIEKSVLKEFREEMTDIPGSRIPQKYFEYLRFGDTLSMPNIFYHNRIDIRSMFELLYIISNLLGNFYITDDKYDGPIDRIAQAKLFEDCGDIPQSMNIYHHILSVNPNNQTAIMNLSFLHKQLGQYPEAKVLWQTAAISGDIIACIELAKFEEHRQKNYISAMKWSKKALNFLDNTSDQFIKQYDEIIYRMERLKRKIDD